MRKQDFKIDFQIHSANEVKQEILCLKEVLKKQDATTLDTMCEVRRQNSKFDEIKKDFVAESQIIRDEIIQEFDINGKVFNVVRDNSRAAIDQIVAESQIVQEIIQNSRKLRTSYTCDFKVQDFNKWKGSGGCQFSNLWYIDQLRSHVKARARFQTRHMSVRLLHGQYPRMLGLSPAVDSKEFQVNVKVMKQDGEADDLDLTTCDKICIFNQSSVPIDGDGWSIVGGYNSETVSYTDLQMKGFIASDSALFRFEIIVMQ